MQYQQIPIKLSKNISSVLAKTFNTVGAVKFIGFFSWTVNVATESGAQARVLPCFLKNLSFDVTSNTSTTNCTVQSRKNGVNGNLLITITALTLGIFADTLNFDTCALNDLACLTTGAATTGTVDARMYIEIDNL